MRIIVLPAVAVLLLTVSSFFQIISADDITDTSTPSMVSLSVSNELPEVRSKEMVDDDTDSNEVPELPLTYEEEELPWINSAEGNDSVIFEDDHNFVPIDCCPTRFEMSAMNTSRNIRGESVTLYKSDVIKQQFVEVACKEGIAGRPCRFMGKPISSRTRCVQKFGFTYGLVLLTDHTRNSSKFYTHDPKPIFPAAFNTETEKYMLDHIRVRSGCGCQLGRDQKKVATDVPIRKMKRVTKFKHKKRMSVS